MLNRGLLLAGGKAGANQTIGAAGGMGFGVGCYGGDSADLDAMGLTPMDGCFDPASDNYGNYVHANGSIMCCIPAFCYRLGNAAAPSYARDGANALEIADATNFSGYEAGASFSGNASLGDGWILHRAFVDGGVVKRGFFIDKYLCSNQNGVATSVKGADWLMCYNDASKTYYTKSLGGDCVGLACDAITLSRARGDQYSICSIFQWSAISMLSLAHGQAATSADACAWYDSGHTTNFPKGNTNQLKDYNDSSLTFTTHTYGSPFAKTGTCSNFAKSTHNGQNNGVADVAGCCNQLTLGAENPSGGEFSMIKPSVAMHSITKDNRSTSTGSANWDHITGHAMSSDGDRYFGGTAFYGDTSGVKWSACGVIPTGNQTSAVALFGGDQMYAYYNADIPIKVGLGYSWGSKAGVWCRSFGGYDFGFRWSGTNVYFGFRASGYASE